MIKKKSNSVSLWLFESLLGYGEIKHFISSRTGGSSCRPWDSLNLSFNTLDDAKAVLDNRQHLSEALQIPLTSITTAKQVHGRHVRILSRSLKGRGACDYHSAINSTDALVTDVPGICPTVLLADCVPILMYDPSKRVVGVVHAGWKGTLGTISQKTVEIFRKDFGSMPEEIIACIGPSIGPCCFQVGHEVITQIENAFGTKEGYITKDSQNGGYFNLWKANQEQLIRAGLLERNIESARICTAHNTDQFFSHRGEKGKTGRFAAGILIC